MAGTLTTPASLTLTADGRALAVHDDGRSIHWDLSNRWGTRKDDRYCRGFSVQRSNYGIGLQPRRQNYVVGSGPPAGLETSSSSISTQHNQKGLGASSQRYDLRRAKFSRMATMLQPGVQTSWSACMWSIPTLRPEPWKGILTMSWV